MSQNNSATKKQVNIIGGGAAALFLASKLDPEKFHVTIYEKNSALARKFLVAGKGGFNLTHSESKERFIEKYSPKEQLQNAFFEFDNTHFICWLKSIGVPTFIGSSHRVFPHKGIKPIEVLKAIENELQKKGVVIKYGLEFIGWDEKGELVFGNKSSNVILSGVEGTLIDSSLLTKQKDKLGKSAIRVNVSSEPMSHFDSPSSSSAQAARKPIFHEVQVSRTSTPLSVTVTNQIITIFALGGSSWKVTGSDGTWQQAFKNKGIDMIPFQASNCAFKVEWSSEVKKKLAGQAIKNAVFSCADIKHKGEAVITEFGIEGSGVYPLSRAVRVGLEKSKKAIISIDLKPELSIEKIKAMLNNRSNVSVKDILFNQVKLSDTAYHLIKLNTTKEEYNSTEILSELIKNFKIEITGLAPIDEAISTVGGVSFNELTENFELKKLPNTFCIGEMIDWDAPTGGYLLQMCFSMGSYVGKILNKRY